MKNNFWGIKKTLSFSAVVFAALILMATACVFNAYAQEATPEPTSQSQSEQPTQPQEESSQEPEQSSEPENNPEPTSAPETSEPESDTEENNPQETQPSEQNQTEEPNNPTPDTSTPEASESGTPSSNTEQPSTSPSPNPSSTPAPTNVTTPQVSLNTPYTHSNMKVVFTQLPSNPGSLTFTLKNLSSTLVNQLQALSETVYEITSSMSNGSFTYDLTLPLPAGVTGTNFKVFYAESLEGLNNPTQISQQITNNGDGTFTIHGLTHFTVFVVVNPNSQANCDAVTVGTTPGSTCFTTIQAAVNAAVDGDTINVGSTGSPYNETVYVNKNLTINGVGSPTVTGGFILQKTPVTITGFSGSTTVRIETPTVSLTNPVNSSNQTNVTISGTGAANATVNWTITGTSGSVSGTGLVDSSGNINITGVNVSTLPDGALTLTVSLSSGTYTSNNATASSFKDTIAPTAASNLTLTNPIGPANQTNVSFSGNGETGSTVNWTLSNGASSLSGTTTVSGAGTFSVSGLNVSSFPDGTLTLNVTLRDAAGNTSSTASTTATKDTVAPTVNAGPNTTTNTSFTTSATASDPVPSSGLGTFAWSQVSGPGTITFGTPSALNTTVSTNQDGTYVVRLTVTDNAGNASSSQFTLVWDTVAPIISGLTNATTNTTVTRTATVNDPAPSSGIATTTWSQVSGPGTVTFGSPNSTSTTLLADVDGTYIVRFTTTDNAGNSSFQNITFIWDTVNPTVDAGPNQVENSTFTQVGSATDATSGVASVTWSQVSGPGVISFGSPNATTTTVSASVDGTYVIQLSATDNAGNTATDTFTLVWDTVSPVVDAGPNINANSTFTTTATASDPAPSSGIASYQWVQVSGPGTLTFGTPNALNTTVTADTDGVHVVQLTVTDNAGNSTSSNFSLTWDTVPPTVNAGPDTAENSTFTTSATASDPAPSSSIATYQWSQTSGPGTITFGTPNSLNTTVTADTDGTYVITLTVTDGAGNSSSDSFTLDWDTVSPVVDAGPDRVTNTQFTQNGTATDPAPSSGGLTYQWAQVLGPGVVSFGTPNAASTTVSANADGNYVISLTVTDAAGNSSTDTFNLTWDTTPPTVSAGPNVNTNQNNFTQTGTASDSLSGVATTVWSTVSGPGPAFFGSPNSLTTYIELPHFGTYVIGLTATDAAGNSAQSTFTTNFQPAPSAGPGGGSSSTGGAPGCNNPKPGGTPVLLSAKVVGGKILLTWSKVSGATHYQIVYGLGKDSYQFGVPNTGNVSEYEIGGLQAGVVYYFRIKAMNGCNGSEYSNELSARAGGPTALERFGHQVVQVSSRALGVREALAAESEATEEAELDSEEEEATDSAEEESTPSAEPTSSPTESPTTEVRRRTITDTIRDILITAGAIILVAAGALYYTTLKKKV